MNKQDLDELFYEFRRSHWHYPDWFIRLTVACALWYAEARTAWRWLFNKPKQ